MPELNADNFLDRHATCPLCLRNNVRLRYYAGNVVFEEHPMGTVVVAHLAHPSLSSARGLTATYARLRCPASLAPLVPMEGS